ncbi:MAG: SirA-like domain-containing protein [Cycloclasticus sp. symbiont of Poecilosclerida sp. M]|nr:MAG: SirA-like domain-containing protein [Cycloclasticus sp. symbiont of Poecilosclerida sp. M]
MNYDITLDVTGLNCPLPLLRLKQLLPQVNPGEVIQVLATDPAAHLDLGVFINHSSHEMLLHERKGDVQLFYIQTSADK